MKDLLPSPTPRLLAALALCLAACGTRAADFSVMPIRAELKPGSMNETITVTNEATTRLRVTMKLMEWTQDANGKDVYTDSADLVYFPRQMDIEPGQKRLVRVGARQPAGTSEKAYRLFIEETPDAAAQGSAAVAFYFRFGVPIFLPPPAARAQPEVDAPTVANGKVAVVVRNTGNQHFRLDRITVSDASGSTRDVLGWYSLAGSTRSYEVQLPRDVCRRAGTLSVKLEGQGLRIDRSLHVDPASCG